MLDKIPNWLASLIVALIAALSAYLAQGQEWTWAGLAAALIGAVGNWITTNNEKQKNEALKSALQTEMKTNQ